MHESATCSAALDAHAIHCPLTATQARHAPEGTGGLKLAVVDKVRKRVVAGQLGQVGVAGLVELAVPALWPARRMLEHALRLVLPLVVLHQVAGHVLLPL